MRSGEGRAAAESKTHTFDAGLDYLPANASTAKSPFPDDGQAMFAAAAERIVAETQITSGYCLVLGCGRGRLAYELAKRTKLKIVGIDEDPAAVAAARKALDDAGLYGVRVTVQQGSLSKLPFANYLANLIVSERLLTEGKLPGSAAEMYRVLRPAGGVAWLGSAKLRDRAAVEAGGRISNAATRWLKAGGVTAAKVENRDGVWATIKRPRCRARAIGRISTVRPTTRLAARTTSFAATPACYGSASRDRGRWSIAAHAIPRRCPPAGGCSSRATEFCSGWTPTTARSCGCCKSPNLVRANVPRDASNMAAAEDALHVVVRDKCWRLDPATGKRLATFELPAKTPDDKHEHEWGYIARTGPLVIGTAIKRGSGYVAGQGEWYDGAGWESDKVTSTTLFAATPRPANRGGSIAAERSSTRR